MDFEELLTYCINNSFAIVMCVYMIVVNNKTVKENTEAVQNMNMLLETMIERGLRNEQ